MQTILYDLSKKINIELKEEQISKFLLYKNLLQEWNEKINLTAIVEDEEIILKHFIDSLTIIEFIEDNNSIIDVGTGAGFPGIPIKIANENTKITLLDSLNKRLNFLNKVIDDCGLKDISTVHGRAEDVGNNKDYREKYDIATARAVANLSTLTELCLPFVKIGGRFIAMKGSSIEELEEAKKAIEILGGEVEKTVKITLPNSDIERNIIIIKKIKSTPKGYPRKAGIPANKPLK